MFASAISTGVHCTRTHRCTVCIVNTVLNVDTDKIISLWFGYQNYSPGLFFRRFLFANETVKPAKYVGIEIT